MNQFDASVDKELKEILADCYGNTKLFAKTFFPNLFSSPFESLHNQIFDLIDSGARKIAIAAPRGIGKTTIARTVAAKKILYRDAHFVPYISNSADNSIMQTENIKRNLLTQVDVRKVFGSIKISDTEYIDEAMQMDEQFSIKCWVAFGNTIVMPRGSGQQIRGLNWSDYRPDLFIIDDLEKKDELRNEENRKKLKDWFFSDVMNSIDQYKDDYLFLYIDTLKHEDSLLQTLIDSSDWESLVLSVCDEKYESLAPHFMSTEKIGKLVDAYREKGLLDVFYMEYMNMPTGGEDQSFPSKYFKYYNEPDLIEKGRDIETVVIIDPAKTVKVQASDSAIIAVGIDLKSSALYFRDCISTKLYPDEIYTQAFNMAERLGAYAIGYEVTSLNEFIKQPMKNEMLKRGRYFELVELATRGGMRKEERIKALVPYYRQGYVYHNPTCCGKLEAQLLSFPYSKLWDVMDAFAYVIEMMELGERYFSPQGSEMPGEDEYAGLVYDEPMKWEHRICP